MVVAPVTVRVSGVPVASCSVELPVVPPSTREATVAFWFRVTKSVPPESMVTLGYCYSLKFTASH